jgi:F0F1-type ATP synthase membrane subunit b/b'
MTEEIKTNENATVPVGNVAVAESQMRSENTRGRGGNFAKGKGKPGARTQGGRKFAPREKPEFDSKTISIRRVTRVVAGGRRFSLAVSLVAGDRNGRIGLGTGKSIDTQTAIEKALKDADAVAKDKAEFEVWRGKQIAEARNESAAIITAAQKSAEKIGADIMEATRREQEELTGRAKQQIAEEQERAIQAAKQELAGLVVQATQKILGEKLDVQQDKALIKKSLEETIS